MFAYLNQELELYTKEHFGDIVYEYVFNNNTEMFLKFAEDADKKCEVLENEIVKLFKMSRSELEELQLNESFEESKKYIDKRTLKDKEIFDAQEFCEILNESKSMFEFGSTMRKVIENAYTRSFHNINKVKEKFSGDACNFSFKILDYSSYRDQKIKVINNEIDAILSKKRWTMTHIEHITAARLLLKEKEEKVSVYKFEVIPLLCEKTEFDIDSIKYATYFSTPSFSDDTDSYNAVYEGTEFYSGAALEQNVIEECISKINTECKTQVININSEFDLKVTRLV